MKLGQRNSVDGGAFMWDIFLGHVPMNAASIARPSARDPPEREGYRGFSSV